MRKIYLGLILILIVLGIKIGYSFGNIKLLMYVGIILLIHGLLKVLFRYYRNYVESEAYKTFKQNYCKRNYLAYINKEVIIGIIFYLYSINTDYYRKFSLLSYVAIGILVFISFMIYHIFENYVIKKSSNYISYIIKMTYGILLWIILLLGFGFIYTRKFLV